MRKVNLFKAFLTTALSVSLVTSPVFAATKTTATKTVAKAKTEKLRAAGLGMLTFAQVANLNDRMRREYIAVLRRAVANVEGLQNSFGRTYGSNGSQNSDVYALDGSNVLDWLIGTAEAQSEAGVIDANRCIHGGNLSSYPEAAYQKRGVPGGRVAGQCQAIPCTFGAFKGYRCSFTYSGLINQPNQGCLLNSVVSNARATKTCDDRRKQLAQEKKSETDSLIQSTNAYFGFNPGGTYTTSTCKSDDSKKLFNRLIEHAYDNAAYGLLIKAAYFCKSNGQGLPDGLRSSEDVAGSFFDFNALEKDFNGLTSAVEKIYAGYNQHCPSLMPSVDVKDLDAKYKEFNKTRSSPTAKDGHIAGARPGSDFYAQEANRLLWYEENVIGKKQKARHDNVLEVEECSKLYAQREELRRQVADIAGTYPHLDDGNPPPHIPQGAKDAVAVYPTGCTEAVTREGSNLAQPAARCMPCLIQSTENIKDKASREPAVRDNAGTYRASRKYLSLVSTMALACGDGMLYDSVVTPEMMVDYMHAFAYCKSDTYEWDDNMSTDTRNLTQDWASQKYWREHGPNDNRADSPDSHGHFKNVYGINYEDAKQMFCGDGKRGGLHGRTGYSPPEKKALLADRRNRFEKGRAKIGEGSDRNYSGALADCLSEASNNAAAFNRDSNLCIGFESFERGVTPAYAKMREGFLEDPAVTDFDNDCAIPKQVEVYKTKNIGGSVTVCADDNGDGMDDKTNAPCTKDSFQCLSWVNPRDATPAGQEFQKFRCAPSKPDQRTPTFTDSGVEGNTARYTYRTASACDISSGEVRRAPPVQRAGDQ